MEVGRVADMDFVVEEVVMVEINIVGFVVMVEEGMVMEDTDFVVVEVLEGDEVSSLNDYY